MAYNNMNAGIDIRNDGLCGVSDVEVLQMRPHAECEVEA